MAWAIALRAQKTSHRVGGRKEKYTYINQKPMTEEHAAEIAKHPATEDGTGGWESEWLCEDEFGEPWTAEEIEEERQSLTQPPGSPESPLLPKRVDGSGRPRPRMVPVYQHYGWPRNNMLVVRTTGPYAGTRVVEEVGVDGTRTRREINEAPAGEVDVRDALIDLLTDARTIVTKFGNGSEEEAPFAHQLRVYEEHGRAGFWDPPLGTEDRPMDPMDPTLAMYQTPPNYEKRLEVKATMLLKMQSPPAGLEKPGDKPLPMWNNMHWNSADPDAVDPDTHRPILRFHDPSRDPPQPTALTGPPGYVVPPNWDEIKGGEAARIDYYERLNRAYVELEVMMHMVAFERLRIDGGNVGRKDALYIERTGSVYKAKGLIISAEISMPNEQGVSVTYGNEYTTGENRLRKTLTIAAATEALASCRRELERLKPLCFHDRFTRLRSCFYGNFNKKLWYYWHWDPLYFVNKKGTPVAVLGKSSRTGLAVKQLAIHEQGYAERVVSGNDRRTAKFTYIDAEQQQQANILFGYIEPTAVNREDRVLKGTPAQHAEALFEYKRLLQVEDDRARVEVDEAIERKVKTKVSNDMRYQRHMPRSRIHMQFIADLDAEAKRRRAVGEADLGNNAKFRAWEHVRQMKENLYTERSETGGARAKVLFYGPDPKKSIRLERNVPMGHPSRRPPAVPLDEDEGDNGSKLNRYEKREIEFQFAYSLAAGKIATDLSGTEDKKLTGSKVDARLATAARQERFGHSMGMWSAYGRDGDGDGRPGAQRDRSKELETAQRRLLSAGSSGNVPGTTLLTEAAARARNYEGMRTLVHQRSQQAISLGRDGGIQFDAFTEMYESNRVNERRNALFYAEDLIFTSIIAEWLVQLAGRHSRLVAGRDVVDLSSTSVTEDVRQRLQDLYPLAVRPDGSPLRVLETMARRTARGVLISSILRICDGAVKDIPKSRLGIDSTSRAEREEDRRIGKAHDIKAVVDYGYFFRVNPKGVSQIKELIDYFELENTAQRFAYLDDSFGVNEAKQGTVLATMLGEVRQTPEAQRETYSINDMTRNEVEIFDWHFARLTTRERFCVDIWGELTSMIQAGSLDKFAVCYKVAKFMEHCELDHSFSKEMIGEAFIQLVNVLKQDFCAHVDHLTSHLEVLMLARRDVLSFVAWLNRAMQRFATQKMRDMADMGFTAVTAPFVRGAMDVNAVAAARAMVKRLGTKVLGKVQKLTTTIVEMIEVELSRGEAPPPPPVVGRKSPPGGPSEDFNEPSSRVSLERFYMAINQYRQIYIGVPIRGIHNDVFPFMEQYVSATITNPKYDLRVVWPELADDEIYKSWEDWEAKKDMTPAKCYEQQSLETRVVTRIVFTNEELDRRKQHSLEQLADRFEREGRADDATRLRSTIETARRGAYARTATRRLQQLAFEGGIDPDDVTLITPTMSSYASAELVRRDTLASTGYPVLRVPDQGTGSMLQFVNVLSAKLTIEGWIEQVEVLGETVASMKFESWEPAQIQAVETRLEALTSAAPFGDATAEKHRKLNQAWPKVVARIEKLWRRTYAFGTELDIRADLLTLTGGAQPPVARVQVASQLQSFAGTKRDAAGGNWRRQRGPSGLFRNLSPNTSAAQTAFQVQAEEDVKQVPNRYAPLSKEFGDRQRVRDDIELGPRALWHGVGGFDDQEMATQAWKMRNMPEGFDSWDDLFLASDLPEQRAAKLKAAQIIIDKLPVAWERDPRKIPKQLDSDQRRFFQTDISVMPGTLKRQSEGRAKEAWKLLPLELRSKIKFLEVKERPISLKWNWERSMDRRVAQMGWWSDLDPEWLQIDDQGTVEKFADAMLSAAKMKFALPIDTRTYPLLLTDVPEKDNLRARFATGPPSNAAEASLQWLWWTPPSAPGALNGRWSGLSAYAPDYEEVGGRVVRTAMRRNADTVMFKGLQDNGTPFHSSNAAAMEERKQRDDIQWDIMFRPRRWVGARNKAYMSGMIKTVLIDGVPYPFMKDARERARDRYSEDLGTDYTGIDDYEQRAVDAIKSFINGYMFDTFDRNDIGFRLHERVIEESGEIIAAGLMRSIVLWRDWYSEDDGVKGFIDRALRWLRVTANAKVVGLVPEDGDRQPLQAILDSINAQVSDPNDAVTLAELDADTDFANFFIEPKFDYGAGEDIGGDAWTLFSPGGGGGGGGGSGGGGGGGGSSARRSRRRPSPQDDELLSDADDDDDEADYQWGGFTDDEEAEEQAEAVAEDAAMDDAEEPSEAAVYDPNRARRNESNPDSRQARLEFRQQTREREELEDLTPEERMRRDPEYQPAEFRGDDELVNTAARLPLTLMDKSGVDTDKNDEFKRIAQERYDAWVARQRAGGQSSFTGEGYFGEQERKRIISQLENEYLADPNLDWRPPLPGTDDWDSD